MKSPQNTATLSIPAHVQELDDTTLRSGHALLDMDRARDFSHWLDSQLNELEERFHSFSTPQSRKRSLGR